MRVISMVSRTTICSAVLMMNLVFLSPEAFAQDDVRVSLTPNGGPPGTVVAVDLLEGSPFSPTAVYGFSFGDDLASLYARTSAQFTWVSPSQLTFMVPSDADCGTHYFGIVAPAPGGARYRIPKGRTPFDVTGPCDPTRRNSLDLLSYNIQFLPDIACGFTNLPCDLRTCSFRADPCDRFALVEPDCLAACFCQGNCGKAERVDLLGRHPDLRPHDVIVFQEAFSDSHRQELRDALRPHYVHQSTVLGRDSGFDQDGGVTVFSKWPIEQVEGHIYTVCNGFFVDCRSAKGVQYVRINKGGQRYHIFGTHTDAGDDTGDRNARINQLFEMREFMDGILLGLASSDEPVIIAGDFNIDKHVTNGDYDFMLRQLKATHPETQDRGNPGARVSTNKSGNWIDYVLYHNEYLQPSSSKEYVFRPCDSRSPYTDGDLSDHFAVLGRFVFNIPAPPPPPPPTSSSCGSGPPDDDPLPSPNHPIDFGYYFVDGKYGDFRDDVNCYTNLYYAWPIRNYFSDAPWPTLFHESLVNAAAEKRKIHLNLNWEAAGSDLGLILDIAAPFWSSIVRMEMEDEPDWSREETESNIALLRSMLQERGLPARPIGVVYTQNQVRFEDAIFANGLDWVGLEAYVDPPGSPVSQDNINALNAFLNQAKNRVPASKDLVLVMMAYDRNGAWPNIDSLLDLQTVPYLHAYDDPRVIAITMFSYGRPGGTRDHPELKIPHQQIARAIFETQDDECVVTDPPGEPPSPSGPQGCITDLRPTFSWSAVERATRYRIVVIHVARDLIVFNATTTGLSFTAPTDLLGGQEYRWKVRGVNSAGGGPWSDSVYFHTRCDFDGPYLLSAGPGCVDTLRPTFVWGAVPGARDYRIVVAPAGTDDFFISEFPAATSFTPSFDLQAGQEYRWKVKGRNEVVDGTFSRHRFFTPMCSPNVGTPSPLTPWFTTIPTGNPIFSWEVASNADAYDLLVTTPSGSVVFQDRYSAELICSELECSVTPALSLGNGVYVWSVTGRTTAQNGPGSPAISFIVSLGAPAPAAGTPTGLNVVTLSEPVTTTFELVGTVGTMVVLPIHPATVGPLPTGFQPFRNMAFDVSTTAQYFERVTVTFQMPSDVTIQELAQLRVFHHEVDVLANRTSGFDFVEKTISARVNSLSPFVIAQIITNHPPVARCNNIEVAADSSCSASVQASAIDAGSSDPDPGDSITLSLDHTGPFGLGPHIVILTATDRQGVSSSCSAQVTVKDTTSPTITAPTAVSVSTGSGATTCGAVVNDALLGAATASDNCSGVTVSRSGVPVGNFFPVGTTTITYTATDTSGNTKTATQSVTVVDNTPPSITPPPNITRNNDPGSCSAVITALGVPVTSDHCAVAGTTNDAPTTGVFPVGRTIVHWTVTDIHGNSSTAEQTVTVVDNTPPSITPPANITRNNDPGSCSAVITALGVPVTSDNCAVAGTTNDAPTTGVFPVGATIVHWTATDIHGNTKVAEQTVTILDAEPPKLTCPANITAEFSSDAGAVVLFPAPVTTDNCPGASAICQLPSGSPFPIGTTAVTCSATDASANRSTCQFAVTVLGARGVKQNVLSELSALRATLADKRDIEKLDHAIKALTESLEPGLWVDQTHVDPKGGDRAFQGEKDAVTDLRNLLESKKSSIPDAVLQGLINRIVKSDRLLGLVAINDAMAAQGDPEEIDKAKERLAQGDGDIAAAKYESGIEHYRNAWKHAQKAVGIE